MKLIIAGTRSYEDENAILKAINLWPYEIFEVVSGCCPTGADKVAILWAEAYNKPVKKFPADWNKYDKAAGPIRNAKMAEYADACIVFWDGKSRGTKNMIDEAIKNKLHLMIYRTDANLSI